MKSAFIVLFISTFASAAPSHIEKALFSSKMIFETKAQALKLQEEKTLMIILGKSSSNTINSSCFDWVYAGPASREEAARACAGVFGTQCLEFVYKGAATRIKAAELCRGVSSIECVEFVYKGPSSREDSAEAFQGVTDMSCVESVYRGSASREEAARSCGYDSHPREPREC